MAKFLLGVGAAWALAGLLWAFEAKDDRYFLRYIGAVIAIGFCGVIQSIEKLSHHVRKLNKRLK